MDGVDFKVEERGGGGGGAYDFVSPAVRRESVGRRQRSRGRADGDADAGGVKDGKRRMGW